MVGRDARHGSAAFLEDVGAVLAGAGVRALLLPRPLPTPVTAFAVRHLGVDAGVMVTASHNPPQDNGIKVFLSDGAQLARRSTRRSSAASPRCGRVLDLPLGEAEVLGEDVWQAYLSAIAALPASDARDVRVAYTPMHGVGLETLLAAFERAGFAAPAVVAEQAEPDPDFPTVAFPNPEEPGALDLLLALSAADADVAISSDPDADRIAVAVGDRPLRGDETGVLLAEHLLSQGVRGRFATTVVSSSMLARVCAAYDVPFTETLTGFKNLARAGDDLVYAYEEALGVAVAPALVRDKDGMSSALLVAELAALEKARGRTLLDRLADLEAALRAPRDPPAVLPGVRPVADRRRRRRPAGLAARGVRAVRRHRGRAAGRRRARAPAVRWPGGRAAERHGAQAQGLPRARRPGGRGDGRAGRGRGRPAGAALRRPTRRPSVGWPLALPG